MTVQRKRFGILSCALLSALAVWACGSDGNDTTGPGTGNLQVRTTTAGPDMDEDGYAVSLDGNSSQNIDVNGAATFRNLDPRDYLLELTGVAQNCVVSGSNPRTVQVSSGSVTEVDFAVGCSANVGDLEAETSTTGSDMDSDGYTVVIDGNLSQSIASNGRVSFANVATGMHSVELTGIASNCSVGGENPRDVEVAFGETSATSYAVACDSLSGSLQAGTTTGGVDLDPDGYELVLDGSDTLAIGINGSATYSGIPVGDHTVELTDLAANCTASGQNPRTVTVPSGGTVETEFDVTCVTNLGALEANASSTGTDIDPDGYTVVVDGGLSQSIAANGSVTFNNLDVGDHSVQLTDVAANCTVADPNPRDVTVAFGDTVSTTFDVDCVPTTGDLQVIASTGGSDTDPDGYTVTLDGTDSQAVGANGQVTFVDVLIGDHTIEVTGQANTCVVAGENPRTIEVQGGITVQTSFDLTCYAIVFESDRDANFEIYKLHNGATSQTNLTGNAALDRLPDASPDGSQVAFHSDRAGGSPDIWVMGINGGGLTNLTPGGPTDFHADWSPDGNQIAFTRGSGGDDEIYVMNSDGSGVVNLTNNPGSDDDQPAWSPDGTQIAFTSARDGDFEVFVMNADGTGVKQLTANLNIDGKPAWSPDGTQIAFTSHRDGNLEVYVMNADGTGQVNLTNNAADDGEAAWSPDGSKIAFVSDRSGDNDVWLMDTDGSNRVNLTASAAGDDKEPSWVP